MKRVLVTMREITSEYGGRRSALDHEYVAWLRQAGALPLPVPVETDPRWIAHYLKETDALVLSGGGPVAQRIEEAKTGRVWHHARDATEAALLKAALGRIPVVAICRGFEFVNLYFGGSLRSVSGHVRTSHRLRSDDPLWSGITVNSYHDFGITKEDLASALRIVAWAEDGAVEVFEAKDAALLGVQWHPERPGAEEGAVSVMRWLKERW